MPHFSGRAALALYKEKGLDIPFIIVSGAIGEEAAVAAMISGAHDYVMKNNLPRLVPAIQRELREAESRRERKRAEEELLHSNTLLNSIVENIPNMIFLKDAKELRFVRFNRAGEDLLGYSKDDLLGKNDYDFFPKAQADFFTEKDREVMHGKEVVDFPEEPLQTRNKGERTLHTKKVPILNAEGKPEYLLGISEDITDQKRAEEELLRTLESLRKAFNTIIQVMVSAVEVRDPYTAGHQIRSADLARAIAMEMVLPQEKTDGIRMAGSIHDIGKLSIPPEILSKPRKLTELEFSLIKEHARSGYEMLKDVESPWPLAQIVYQHHERMNGTGYPRNLKGDEILMEARIMAVADVVEAMASHRPYRPALGIDTALEEIEKNRGTLYDNAVADACLRLFRKKGYRLLA
jgi:PAS domain S-box-containing protein